MLRRNYFSLFMEIVTSSYGVQTFHHWTFNHPTLNHDRVRIRIRVRDETLNYVGVRVINSSPLAMSSCCRVYVIGYVVIKCL